MRPRWLHVALWTAGLLSAARPSFGWHTDEQRITDETAYTLPEGHVRLGLWKVQWTPWSPLLIGTHTFPWAVLAPNAHLKLKPLHVDPVALAVQAGYLRLDTSRLRFIDETAAAAIVTSVPIELVGSLRFGRAFTLSAGAVYTNVRVDGELEQYAFHGAGRAAVDNLQALLTAELRFTRVTALVVHGRYLVYQGAHGEFDIRSQPDAYTTIEAETSADVEVGPNHGYFVAASLVFSFEHFNLKVGAGYGNVNIPSVNFMLDRRLLQPVLDLYWIF